MAVQALARSHAPSLHRAAAALPPIVLAVALVPTALDMLKAVQPTMPLGSVTEVASALSLVVLLGMWLRFPRTTWLAAACFAAEASLALRFAAGAQFAPVLSLLSVVALGIGGAFDTADEADALNFRPERA